MRTIEQRKSEAADNISADDQRAPEHFCLHREGPSTDRNDTLPTV